MSKIPEFHFHYANLLEPYAVHSIPPKEEITKLIIEYVNLWDEYKVKILTALCDITGLTFRNTELDVHVAFTGRSSSIPLIVSGIFKADQLIDILTHELIHRLTADNAEQHKPNKILHQQFKEETNSTRVHIAVFALHTYLILDVLKEPARLERDKKRAKMNPDEKRAYEIVDQQGYMSIINSLEKPS